MKNYSKALPIDREGVTKQVYGPAAIALAATHKENAAASSILLLTHDTTELEVTVIGSASFFGVAGKWISRANVDASVAATSVITAAGTENFDFVIPGGNTRRIVVPISTNPQNAGSIQGVNRAEGLYPAVAYKTFVGTASVLTVQF